MTSDSEFELTDEELAATLRAHGTSVEQATAAVADAIGDGNGDAADRLSAARTEIEELHTLLDDMA